MVPVIRKGQTVRVVAPSDRGTPQTVYVVELYSIEREAATLNRIVSRRRALLADGIAETDARIAEATQQVAREALADITRAIENEQGPDGCPRTVEERGDILAHYEALPKAWFEEVVQAITQPVAVSVTQGKG